MCRHRRPTRSNSHRGAISATAQRSSEIAIIGAAHQICGGSQLIELSREPIHAGTGFAMFSVLSARSEEHTSELQSLMRTSYAVFCLKKYTKTQNYNQNYSNNQQ